MRAALAARHIGRVIRAYRTHVYHGRSHYSQEIVASWLGFTQSRLSRIETGPRINNLDILTQVSQTLRIPPEYLWFALPGTRRPDSAGIRNDDPPESEQNFGASSSARTAAALDAVGKQPASGLRYMAPAGAVDHLTSFLQSASRVYVLKGPPGCGKTRLTYHLASELSSDADFQLHPLDAEDSERLSLATEILRYASRTTGPDALLTLEQATRELRQPLIVVLDGIKTHDQLGLIARQVDVILRHVSAEILRFVLVVRTPPEIEISSHPVLAASIYDPPTGRPGGSYVMSRWEHEQAREAWDNSRGEGEPSFLQLPESIQRLARLPLYMQLVRTAGPTTSRQEMNAYRLVDHCVRSVLRSSGRDIKHGMEMLADLAQSEFPDLTPGGLAPRFTSPVNRKRESWSVDDNALLLLRASPTDGGGFAHDVIGEYFLATRIADQLVQHGRSVAAIGALNELAERATTSAVARGVFEFVVHCLDATAPNLATTIALSPTVATKTTLPLMIRLAGEGTRFAVNGEVLRACAKRCLEGAGLELAKALLFTPATSSTLGDEYALWVAELLRHHGSVIWAYVAASIEQTLDAHAAIRLLDSASLDRADEATFFARYFFLFFSEKLTESLQSLLGHTDWRVRAALAEGVRDAHSPFSQVARLIMDTLVRDDDYKVRAATAMAVGRATASIAPTYMTALLMDTNWHVRECLLDGILANNLDPDSASSLAEEALATLDADDTWSRCPSHLETLRERLRFLHGVQGDRSESTGRHHALFTLIREQRTGWIRLARDRADALVREAQSSSNWLVSREAVALTDDRRLLSREAFRRLRGHRAVQVALDLRDIDRAITVARSAVQAGFTLIEVGDPLIKEMGLSAITRIKRDVPDAIIVAEMMSADWGREQVILAAEAGADVVLLIGPATTASVATAAEAGRRLGIPIVLDIPAARASQQWINVMEGFVDGFAVTTNIDLGVGGQHPLSKARAVRSWTQLPVAVSGGFSAADYSIIGSSDWDILIVGRSIAEAVQPGSAATQLAGLINSLAPAPSLDAKDSNDFHTS